MNKIYMTKQNARGQSVVCSEKSKARGKMKTLVLAVSAVGAMFTSAAYAQTVGILGYPTGADAVAIGQDAWATSVSGVATGHESIATGTDITRAEFDELSAKHKAALDKYKAAQDAVVFAGNDIDANRNAIDQLAKEVADLEAKQKAAAAKLAERDKLNAQKDPFANQLPGKEADLAKALENLKSVQDASGKNLFLDFTNVLNSLNWSPLTAGGDSNANRDTIAAELKQKVEANHPEFASKYDQAKYRNIVDGFINRQASYQGSVEGITSQLSNASSVKGWYQSGAFSNTPAILLNNLYYNLPKDTAAYDITKDDIDVNGVMYHLLRDSIITPGSSSNVTTKEGVSYIGNLLFHPSSGVSTSLKNSFHQGTKQDISPDVLSDYQKILNNIVLTKKIGDVNPYSITKTARTNPVLNFLNGGAYGVIDVSSNKQTDFAKSYNTASILKVLSVDNHFNIKQNDGTYKPYYAAETDLHKVLLKINDYTVNNNNLISSSDIASFRTTYHNQLKSLLDNTAWSDAEAAYNMADYRKKLEKAYAFSSKVDNLLSVYQEVIDEAKKANPDRSLIDRKTAEILSLKEQITKEKEDVTNYSVGIVPVLSAKGNEYIAAVKPQYDAIMGRINTELKLYNDKDELIVEATSKAKDFQAQYDAAKKAVDDLKKQIAAIDAEIAKLGLTPDEMASADLKAQKQKELDAANKRKDELEKALADKMKAAEDARLALDGTGMKDRGLRNLAAGYDAFASGDDSIAIGTTSSAMKQNAIAIGTNATVSGVNSIAIGSDNVIGGDNSVAIGVKNNVAANDTVVLGNNITVPTSLFNSVVLGNNSTVAAATPTANITIREKTHEFAGKTPAGVVSVGSDGKERQIQNVAAGRVTATSTDAINGSQLYSVVDALNTLKVESGMNIAAEKGTVTPNAKQITLKGDGKNISTTANGDVITINLNDDPTFNSVTVGDVKLTKDGINAGDKKITNVANGTIAAGSKDAVNGGQLYNVTQQVANNTKAIQDLNDDLTNTKVAIVQNTKDIEDLKPKVAKNTADIAKNKTDIAANKAEIENLKPRVAKNEADIAKNTADIETNRANIAKGLNFKTQDDVTTNKQLGDTVTVLGDNKNISTQTVGGNIVVKMTDNARLQTLTLGKDAEISATSKQAVNGSQLHATNMNVTNNAKAIQAVDAKVEKGINARTDDGKTTNYKLGDTINVAGDGKNTVSLTSGNKTVVALNPNLDINSVKFGNSGIMINQTGINAGNKTINNVADGAISADSKQAVNGSQLHAAYNYFNDNLTGLRKHVDSVEDNLEAAIAGTNAAASLPQITMSGKSMLSVAGGGYADKGAVAVGFSRLSDNGRVTLKSHVNANTEKKVGYGVGLGFTW